MAAAFAAAPILTTVIIGATVVSAAAAGYAAYRSSQAAEAEREREELAEQSFAIEGVQSQNAIMEDELRRGLWDPELTPIFLNIVRTRPESLQLPERGRPDRSAVIQAHIERSGVLGWRPAQTLLKEGTAGS